MRDRPIDGAKGTLRRTLRQRDARVLNSRAPKPSPRGPIECLDGTESIV